MLMVVKESRFQIELFYSADVVRPQKLLPVPFWCKITSGCLQSDVTWWIWKSIFLVHSIEERNSPLWSSMICDLWWCDRGKRDEQLSSREYPSKLYWKSARGLTSRSLFKQLGWSELPQVKWHGDPNYPWLLFVARKVIEGDANVSGSPSQEVCLFVLIFSGPTEDTLSCKMVKIFPEQICVLRAPGVGGKCPSHFCWDDLNSLSNLAYWSVLPNMG
jgi:hypothetical protein